MTYQTHFATQSAEYQQYRPTYPDALFNYLASLVTTRELAWDCATGNGQAAIGLSPYFERVLASDAQIAQLEHAVEHPNVEYNNWPANKTGLEAERVDLITVAQALHWLDFESFYDEVRRVLKPGGILAAWCYAVGHISPEIDKIVQYLYADILKASWPSERRYIDDHYRSIPFPFEPLENPTFEMEKTFDFQSFMGYLGTWSAVKEYQKQHNQDPLILIADDIKTAFGDADTMQTMVWPLHLLVGRHGTD